MSDNVADQIFETLLAHTAATDGGDDTSAGKERATTVERCDGSDLALTFIALDPVPLPFTTLRDV